jgi:hypothetical protein
MSLERIDWKREMISALRVLPQVYLLVESYRLLQFWA